MIAAIRSHVSVNESILYVAFELGKKDWKLAVTSGFQVKPWLRPASSPSCPARRPRTGSDRKSTRLNSSH